MSHPQVMGSFIDKIGENNKRGKQVAKHHAISLFAVESI